MDQLSSYDQWLNTSLFGSERLSPALPVIFSMAATYGLIKASCFVSRLLAFAWRHACRKPLNLYERYGSKTKKSWAVVTGGSDGYGLDLCHKLADQGFNICIVARNEQKMKDKLAEIKADVDKKYIVANLMTMTRIEEY